MIFHFQIKKVFEKNWNNKIGESSNIKGYSEIQKIKDQITQRYKKNGNKLNTLLGISSISLPAADACAIVKQSSNIVIFAFTNTYVQQLDGNFL